MGKRSNFARVARDYYPTPGEAVEPLLPHLPESFTYIEPCAGDGALIRSLPGHCVFAGDIEPRGADIGEFDAFAGDWLFMPDADFIITNPPWERKTLHRMIEVFSGIPTWLLFDADWMHTRQAAPYLGILHKVVSVGRVKWIPNSAHTGKDNCAWYHFDTEAEDNGIEFVGRQA